MSAADTTARGAPQTAEGPKVDWFVLLLGFAGMVVGQFMAILDIQIVAASLPQIQAGVGASNDEISWVQTAYLIPEVVMIPLSGYLARWWGTQRLFLISATGFVVMSILAGMSNSIDMLIICRALQGFVGGAMIPTVFAVAFTAFPPSHRVTASVIMGLIVTLAPTIGPTLGGHLTELLSWRWLFFVNVIPGVIVLFLVSQYGNFDEGDPELAKGFDWWGLGLMAAFLMSLQFVLEEGAKNDWFADSHILLLSVVALLTGPAFIWRTLAYRNPIVELRAFTDRNFTVGVIMTFVTGAALFGGTFLLPLFLGRVGGYSSAEVGTIMVVSGLAMFLTAPIAGRIARRVDPRVPMFVGFMLAAWGMWSAHEVTPEWGFWEFASVQAFRGVGVMLAMIASQNVTMSTLTPEMIKNASGLVNLARNVGGAFGLAALNTLLTERSAVHMGELTSRISTASSQTADMLTGLTARFEELGLANPTGAAYAALNRMIQLQATNLAFADAFVVLGLACAAAAFIVLLAKPVRGGLLAPDGDMH